MFAEHDMGVAVDISDYDALANAVIELYHNPEKLKKMAENAYKYGSEHYSSIKSTATLINILERHGQKR
jgi:colanic acid biosynthesis glycosyl transferase WcaI